MHNLKDIRKNIDIFKRKIKERNSLVDFDHLLNLDKENRNLIQKKENLEKEKKEISKSKDKNNFKKSKKLSFEIDKLLKDHEILKNNFFVQIENSLWFSFHIPYKFLPPNSLLTKTVHHH